jgi:hypothetical protein
MIHRIRKKGGKRNCTVYGIMTDSHDFVFWKLDENARVRDLFLLRLLRYIY